MLLPNNPILLHCMSPVMADMSLAETVVRLRLQSEYVFASIGLRRLRHDL
jgi:hypothetical protein